MAYSYPILLDLTGKLVVIIGGGCVAERKARGAVEGGASAVRCIAPEFDKEFIDETPPRVELITARFDASHLDGADLAFAATDSPEINAEVVRAARERKILVARADGDDHGDFLVPANWRTKRIVVSVSTGSPTLSIALRDEIEATVTSINAYELMAEAMEKFRPWLLNSGSESKVYALYELASKAALEILQKRGVDALYRWLVEKYPELKLEKAP